MKKSLVLRTFILLLICAQLIACLYGCGKSEKEPEKLSYETAMENAKRYAKSSKFISAISRMYSDFYWSFGPYCTNCVLSQNGDSYSCVIQGGAGYRTKSGEFRDFNDFTMIVDVDAYTGLCSSTYEN